MRFALIKDGAVAEWREYESQPPCKYIDGLPTIRPVVVFDPPPYDRLTQKLQRETVVFDDVVEVKYTIINLPPDVAEARQADDGSAGAHHRDRILGERVERERIGLHAAAEMLQTHLQRGFQHPERGVADHKIDAVEFLLKFREGFLDAAGIGDIGLHREGFSPHPADEFADRFGLLVAVVIEDRDVAARRGELQRSGTTDPPGPAGDKGNFS